MGDFTSEIELKFLIKIESITTPIFCDIYTYIRGQLSGKYEMKLKRKNLIRLDSHNDTVQSYIYSSS